MGMRDRIRKRRNAKKPQQQYYGGSKDAYAASQARNQTGIDAGQNRVDEGLIGLDDERAKAAGANHALGQSAAYEEGVQRGNARVAGEGSDQSLADYRGGREALLGSAGAIDANAGAMEQLARSAPGQYQSSADAAHRAATERNQRNALALAAGRGSGSIRTALATAQAGNQQAALDQQVVRAQEMNQLLGLQGSMYQGAAGVRGQGAQVRSSVSAQDQQAAQIQAQRQQAATGAAQQALGQQAQISAADAAIGANASGARLNAGAGARDSYMATQSAMETAQLGQNAAFEQQRLANAKTKGPFQKIGSVVFDPMNFRGSEAGGLGSVY